MDRLARFSQSIAGAVSRLGETDFSEVLSSALTQLVEADDVSLIRYGVDHSPAIEYTMPPTARTSSTLDRYVTGPFLLDPFYRAASIEGRFGVFRLRDLAPKGFRDSEYYRTWYHECGFQDECGLLIQLDTGFVNLALGRIGKGVFSKAHVQLLQAIFPAIEALVCRHWRDHKTMASGAGFRHRLQHSLSAFGSSVLTPREREVIELVLLGNSTRLIAEKLAISTETVKLHRKHAYAKLDISSQAELFYLFVDALASHTGDDLVDPLSSYQGPREQHG